jgi:hypothetical protein
MGLLRRIRQAGEKVARSRVDSVERLTPRSDNATTGEQAALTDGDTVRSWLRDMGPDDTVLVHRAWGTIAARADRSLPPGVLFSDETGAWFAAPPETDEERLLTWFEVERIVLDAMTSPARPSWPRWVALS